MNRAKGADMDLIPIKSPCNGCPRRFLGCHSKCEEYAAFREECDELAEERRRKREHNEYIADVIKRFPGKINI